MIFNQTEHRNKITKLNKTKQFCQLQTLNRKHYPQNPNEKGQHIWSPIRDNDRQLPLIGNHTNIEIKKLECPRDNIAKHLSELGAKLRRYFQEPMAQTTGFVIPFMPCLQSTYRYLNKRVSSKLQQAVLWKLNLIRSHWQISGLGCAQSILPWQIMLLRHWCPLQPCTVLVLITAFSSQKVGWLFDVP